jgi:CIC family chloride channel protein
MSATFATPVAAVLLAVELLLFELRPRSLVPVAIASATAAILGGSPRRGPLFQMPGIGDVDRIPFAISSLLLGAVVGLIAAAMSRMISSL